MTFRPVMSLSSDWWRGSLPGMLDEQYAFDEVFESIVACEASLDDVIAKLADVGIPVELHQRGVVNDWLQGFGGDVMVPLRWRLFRLRHLLGVRS